MTAREPFDRAAGTEIEPSRALRFEFDGVPYEGRAGDTLASALMANGVRVIGRSFKYHRPRGVVTAGAEEPNGIVQLDGADDEPHARATTLMLREGLSVFRSPAPHSGEIRFLYFLQTRGMYMRDFAATYNGGSHFFHF